MNSNVLEFVLNSTACRGAFKTDGMALTPLSSGAEHLHQSAQRTHDLWASMTPMLSDAGLIVASRGTDQSIASARGGIILEASGSINLGMLKSALKQQDHVEPASDLTFSETTDAGQVVLWNLVDWISSIEAPRLLNLHLGEDVIAMVAQKGAFACLGKQKVSAVASKVQSAIKAKSSISLSYDQLGEKIPTCDCDPVALFGASRNDTGEWVHKADGTPVSIPQDADFADIRQMAVFTQRLDHWREGLPCELAVLHEERAKEVVAIADSAEEIKITAPLFLSEKRK